LIVHQFGFLRELLHYELGVGRIHTLPTFRHAEGWIKQWMHQDGFVYRPAGYRQDKEGKAIPNTGRPMSLHRLPTSLSTPATSMVPSVSGSIMRPQCLQTYKFVVQSSGVGPPLDRSHRRTGRSMRPPNLVQTK